MTRRGGASLRLVCWILIAANVAMVGVLLFGNGEGGTTIAPPPSEPPPIHLLGEASSDAERAGGAEASRNADGRRDADGHRDASARGMETRRGRANCIASGPLANLRDAMALAARVDAGAGRAEVREAIARGRPDHVVYIEPAASPEAARRTLRELEGQAITGQLVDGGALANAVALGVFARRAEADAMLARVAALGYSVKRRPLERAHEVYLVHSTGSAPGDPREGWVPCDDDWSAPHPDRAGHGALRPLPEMSIKRRPFDNA